MTKAQALQAFFSSFGVPAFESNFVPSGEHTPDFPYITYDLVTADFGATVYFTGGIWDRTTTLARLNAITDEIARRIGLGGIRLPCDRGHIHLYCGSPWAQTLRDQGEVGTEDDSVHRKYLNFAARFNTMP